MKRKKLFFVLTTIIFIISSCKKDDPINSFDDDKNASIVGSWKVISYEDLKESKQITIDSTSATLLMDVLVTFSPASSAQFNINGSTGTNDFVAKYTSGGWRTIDIKDFSTTEAMQSEWADLFYARFPLVKEYAVNQSQLRIYYNSRDNSITLQRQ